MSRASLVAIGTAIGGTFAQKVMAEQSAPLQEAMELAGASAWADLGFAALQRGESELAGELFGRGLTVPTTFWLIERPRLLAGSALVLLTGGDIDAAAGQIAEARQFAGERGIRHMDPLLTFVEAQIALASGDLPGALDLFERAEGGARTMGMRPLTEQALSAQVQALQRMGRSREADDRSARARAVTEEMRAFIHDPEMLQSFDAARGVPVHG
jgi:ATP/maltotriose-dependent transcriptional regulator MalT